MAVLFETTRIGNMELANRFVRSATNMSMAAEDGSATPDLIAAIRRLAEGEVGLIVTGFAYVTKGGQVVPNMLGCHGDHLLPGLKQMTGAAHGAGGKIALQIEHGGVFSAIGNPPSPASRPWGRRRCRPSRARWAGRPRRTRSRAS